jgi:hypothetical protein
MLNARNLAVGWPWFALLLATSLVAAGPRLRLPAIGLVTAGFALGAAKMVDDDYQRPDFRAAAEIIEREAGPRDGVVDGAVAFLTPGPLTGLEAGLEREHRLVRAGAPQRRDGNFRIGDPILPNDEVARRAADRGGRIFIVVPESETFSSTVFWDPTVPAGYRRVRTRILAGFIPLAVHVYEP